MRTLANACGAGLLLLGGGCSMFPGTDRSMGFDIHVSLPPIVKTPATVQQTDGPTVINGLAAMQAGGQVRGSLTAEPFPQGPATAQLAAGRPACSMDDVCELLRRIDAKVSNPPTAEALKMPRGN